MEVNQLPATNVLSAQLSKIFSGRSVEVIDRVPFKGSSTFPVELISCQFEDGNLVKLFGKYLGGLGPNNHGHRGGVEYEIKVYDQLIQKLPLNKAHFWGQCYFEEENDTLLLMEYLEGSKSLKGNPDINLYLNAAAWIARMHVFFEGNIPAFVKRYDANYYSVWLDRMLNVPEVMAARSWLKDMIDYFRSHLHILTDTPQTLIHGEYYSKNILIRDGDVFPVDWESAACAPAEIDLAAIIEARKEEVATRIKECYVTTRFADKHFNEQEFETRLNMAQLYLHFRFFFPKREEWRYDHMEALGKKLRIFG
jgi:thiamine kinase-like enzyme